MQEPKTLQGAILYFADSDNCHDYMVMQRWPNGVVCPNCGRADARFLKNQRKWQCKSVHALRQFSIKTGTVMESSPIGLEKWLPAMWLIVNCKNGISSYEIARALDVTQKTAWFMLHRIRLAMRGDSFKKLGGSGGPVEVDETFIGGKPKNMHREKRKQLKADWRNDKAIVLGMLDRDARQVRTKVIPNVKRATLQAEILKAIVPVGTVYTDQHIGYDGLQAQRFIHETVTHLEEYVRGDVHTADWISERQYASPDLYATTCMAFKNVATFEIHSFVRRGAFLMERALRMPRWSGHGM